MEQLLQGMILIGVAGLYVFNWISMRRHEGVYRLFAEHIDRIEAKLDQLLEERES